MIQFKNILYFAAALFFFVACDDAELDDFDAGSADFSSYLAMGDSITAGFSDGTTYKTAQENSFPALLAEQMAYVGGSSTFNQPLVNDDLGGLSLLGNTVPGFEPKLYFNGAGPVRMEGTPTTSVTDNISANGPFQNLGVPGAKSFHLLSNGYGNIAGLADPNNLTANPFYVRMSAPDQSLLTAAMEQNATFFTLWIGNNDALSYATTGRMLESLTDPAMFNEAYQALVNGLMANGAKGVVANIPNILDLPYFTVVPAQSIPLTDATTIAAVNQAYATYNGGLQQIAGLGAISTEEAAARAISFSEGVNYPVIIDNDLTNLSAYGLPSIRQLKAGEVLTLPAASILGTLADENNPLSVIGVGEPLADLYSLTATELDDITTHINTYNQIINDIAVDAGLPVVDMNGYFSEISNTGITWNGTNYTTNFVTGGLFSLDGIHPTQKGYAVLANKFIEVINNSYNSSLPVVDINDYPGTLLP